MFSSECLDRWCRGLPQRGDSRIRGGGDEHRRHSSGFHLSAADNKDAADGAAWRLCPCACCQRWRRRARTTHQVNQNILKTTITFASRYKLDTRYSGAGEFFRLDPLSGRVTVRRALKELDSNQASAPILLRVVAQEVENQYNWYYLTCENG